MCLRIFLNFILNISVNRIAELLTLASFLFQLDSARPRRKQGLTSVFLGCVSGISCRQMEMGNRSSSGFLKIWRRAWGKSSGRKPVDSKPISNWLPSSFSLIAFHFSGPASLPPGRCGNKKCGQMEKAGSTTGG